MGRELHPDPAGLSALLPARLLAAYSMPTPMAAGMFGRIELVIGRLGAGKTTWGSLRAQRLARGSGRSLATTGVGWPEPWQCVSSFDEMETLRGVVFVWDEVHLMLPSSRGLLGKDAEKFMIRWLSLCRKREICVIGTTQAWTRCATHYRQIVTTVWDAKPIHRGKLHKAVAFDHPDDGGRQTSPAQYFGPAAARIPTNASVWTGLDLDDDDEPQATAATAAAPVAARAVWSPPPIPAPVII